VKREDIAALSPHERAEVARWLAELRPRLPSHVIPRLRRRRRLMLGTITAATVVLIPWTVWLSVSLPETHRAREWRTAWVGFDIVLLAVLATTAWLAWHRRQAVAGFLVVSATLLLADAWFDVLLSSGPREKLGSILTALLVELPLGALFLFTAYRLMKATATLVWRQQGNVGPPPSFWRLPILATPLETSAPPVPGAPPEPAVGAGVASLLGDGT